MYAAELSIDFGVGSKKALPRDSSNIHHFLVSWPLVQFRASEMILFQKNITYESVVTQIVKQPYLFSGYLQHLLM